MEKVIIKIFTAFVCVALISSCSTSKKVSICGIPGETIYDSDKKVVGTIPASGVLNIKIDDGSYQAFMLSQRPGENVLIPFGLNYRYASHAGTSFTKYFGYTVGFLGVGATMVGGIAALLAAKDGADDSTTDLALATAGAAALGGIGFAIGTPAAFRTEQAAYFLHYKYLDSQTTNSKFNFTKPDIKFANLEEVKPITRPKLRPSQQSDANSSEATSTQKANRKLSGFSSKAEGEYVGYGTISLDGEDLEELNGVTLRITRSKGNEVEVSIIESDGNDFFGAPDVFKVAKDSNKDKKNALILTHTTIPSIVIKIDDEDLIYMNPKVEIDGIIYSLNLTAKKQ